jgi:tRNA-uridine 2-sulfurtransferase
MPSERQRIAVAMSGGVDSSIVAALLRDKGHEVLGITLRLSSRDDTSESTSCYASEGSAAASAAASCLGIPHEIVSCHEAFEREVLAPCWAEYDRGRTPNPCVLCNRRIKFGVLFDHARRRNARWLATGHYAILEHDEQSDPILLRGRDRDKDQSYFLFALGQKQLRAALFPLGRMTKQEVRRLARSYGLPNADRAESQDACLRHGESGFAESLRQELMKAARPGLFIDEKRAILGRHEGIHKFTIGQRKGLSIALGQRAYVVAIDGTRCEVTLSTDPKAHYGGGLIATDVHWIGPTPRETPFDAEVQIRYRHAPTSATIELLDGNRLRILFRRPERAVTPGQAAVIYLGDRVLGGGVIERALGLANEEAVGDADG